MRRYRNIWFLLFVLMFAPVLGRAEASSLDQVQERVLKSFPSVPVMEVRQLARSKGAGDLPPIIFDVRFHDQYDVSHIEGAAALHPATKPEKFAEEYGALISLNPQRKILFYCYVGYNSFAMAERLMAAFPQWAGRMVALKGGVFEWYNQRLPLIDAMGPTPYIHPHDFMWRGFLVDPQNISYEGRQKAGH